jgi:hypothetical protein
VIARRLPVTAPGSFSELILVCLPGPQADAIQVGKLWQNLPDLAIFAIIG